jgi:RHS repeat-associated protein
LASSIGTNENSITNGSFEQGLTNWGTWGTATMVNNTANAHSGSNYVQISATSGGYSGVNNQTISVQTGDQITFGGWVNLQSGSSTSPGWVLAVYNSSLTAIANIVSPTPPSSGWMYQSVNYTVPTGGAYVMLYAQVYQPSGSTVIWVDDGFISTGTAYYHGDHLGSSRVMSDTGGNVIWSATYLPFGQEWNPQPTVNHYKFTGKERDSESGLDNFGARYDSSQYGRFMTPDPLLNSGHPWDPQTWNRYSYVRNNPLSNIDPTGLYDLNNTCAEDNAKCNKQFQQHRADLSTGRSTLQDKVNKMKDGSEKQRLQGSLNALGTEGDHNGL